MEPTPSKMESVETRISDSSTSPSEPPGYYDRVPNSHVFFPPKYPTPGPKPSTAESYEKVAKKFSRQKEVKGICSQDPILDDNPTELWRFLLSNLRSPSLAVLLLGTHTESSSSTDSNGHSTTTTRTVTDFSFQFDVSKYVMPQWSRIVAEPRKASKGEATPMPTVLETLEEYTSSKNPFKEFRLDKLVLWDMERVTQLLTDLARSTGYQHTIQVHFPMQHYKVVALASNGYSKAAHNKAVQVLCVVSCLWILFWPAWSIARKRMKNRLSCEYGMAVSADEFYSRNAQRIHSAVVQRCKSEQMVAW
ncbi:hypothetical protein M758_6G125400 [Ceratodon purpureus]|uniref:Uncharacterized protein n=1 Tax=Ceratodon purpureus TaxID=3225 RepID=A0A8T0HHX6_CERPU|nr:hypothetical protein KC19_6G130700 [Ceratodon purpureus]KAG0613726.1 hypothetical protein M758_6G125400 [Ceratodon purpureus]